MWTVSVWLPQVTLQFNHKPKVFGPDHLGGDTKVTKVPAQLRCFILEKVTCVAAALVYSLMCSFLACIGNRWHNFFSQEFLNQKLNDCLSVHPCSRSFCRRGVNAPGQRGRG